MTKIKRTDEDKTTRRAVLSQCCTYRYSLSRYWRPAGEAGARACLFIMLNPSTADGRQDDPTVRRCMNYARAWHCRELHVLNLFALRATRPSALRGARDPVGPENKRYVRELAMYIARATLPDSPVVCAWGNHGAFLDQDKTMLDWLKAEGLAPQCLRINGATGQPGHPLYLPHDLTPQPYQGRN